jgi:hypothetical protein
MTVGVEWSARRHGWNDLRASGGIADRGRENREEGCKQVVDVRQSHSVMDRAIATNARHEQNVKTCEKISSPCHNNRYEVRRTRDVFKCVSE